jgi:hypothetical protein
MKLIERVVVDECVGQASALLEPLRCRLGDRPIKFVFLATEHPGIPDIEILDKLLDGRSALLTQDRGLHNLAIRRGFRSFVHTPESGLTDRRLAHVSAPDKCLRGARLDEKPQLLFVLRGVDENELLAIAGQDVALSKAAPAAAKMLDDSDVAALFGLEMAETANSATPIPATPKRPQRSKPLNGSKAPPEAKTPAAKISKSPGATRTKSEPKWAALARARIKARAASTSTFGMTLLSCHLPSAAHVPGFQGTGGRANAVRFTRDVS